MCGGQLTGQSSRRRHACNIPGQSPWFKSNHIIPDVHRAATNTYCPTALPPCDCAQAPRGPAPWDSLRPAPHDVRIRRPWRGSVRIWDPTAPAPCRALESVRCRARDHVPRPAWEHHATSLHHVVHEAQATEQRRFWAKRRARQRGSPPSAAPAMSDAMPQMVPGVWGHCWRFGSRWLVLASVAASVPASVAT